MAVHLRVVLLAGAGAAAAVAPWRRRRVPLGRNAAALHCEAQVAPSISPASLHRDYSLNRKAFISGRESTDIRTHYSFNDKLGEGSFGRVILATHRFTGKPRAIKFIPKRENTDAVKKEILALIDLDHPHIVKLVESFEDDAYAYLVQALCDGPDLAELLNEVRSKGGGGLPERSVSIIIRDCLMSVAGCHAHGYVHRDIKLDNFMVTGRDRAVKMIDFGLAARCAPDDDKLTEITGTHLYRAPEMMAKRPRSDTHGYGQAADIWSLGCVLFALLTGESLFRLSMDANGVRDRLKDSRFVQDRLRRTPSLRKCTAEARDLLDRMLKHDPHERIGTSEALAHPFVRQHIHELLGSPEGAPPPEPVTEIFQLFAGFASQPQLRQLALLAAAHSASLADLDSTELGRRLRQTFRLADIDGDGRISLKELRALMASGTVAPAPADLEQIFRDCDINGSNYMNFVEFVACCLPPALVNEQLCSEAFWLLDRDGSGAIEVNDLRMLSESGAARFAGELEALIHEAEVAVHGIGCKARGTLSFEDFHRLLRGADAVAKNPPQRLKHPGTE